MFSNWTMTKAKLRRRKRESPAVPQPAILRYDLREQKKKAAVKLIVEQKQALHEWAVKYEARLKEWGFRVQCIDGGISLTTTTTPTQETCSVRAGLLEDEAVITVEQRTWIVDTFLLDGERPVEQSREEALWRAMIHIENNVVF